MALTVRTILTQLGYNNLPSETMYGLVSKWDAWYCGKTNFHLYMVYNGKSTQKMVRKSLRMAKHMAEDKADLLLNEKVSIVVKNGQDALNQVLADNDFFTLGNQLVEKGQALGTAAFVEYLETDSLGETKIKIDYIDDPRRIWPLSWNKGNVTECAFVSTSTDRLLGKLYYISLHLLEGGKYVIKNYAYTEHGDPVKVEGLVDWESGSGVPTFQIYKPNIANNFDEDSPLGVSIYANSIDTMKVLDTIFDSYFNEFILGRKRIFLDATILNMDVSPDGTGEVKPVFDPNDAVFYNLPGMEPDKSKPIVESNMTLRVEEHQKGIQDTLDLLSEQCGFGKGYYRFTLENVQTATGVISQNSKLYRKIRKDEIMLRNVLAGVARAILLLLGDDPYQDVSVSFDDSIIEDTNTKVNRSLLEYAQGVIDRVMYFMETRGLTEQAATQLVQLVVKREQDPNLNPQETEPELPPTTNPTNNPKEQNPKEDEAM